MKLGVWFFQPDTAAITLYWRRYAAWFVCGVSVPLQTAGIKYAALLAGTETQSCITYPAFLRQWGKLFLVP